MDYQHLNLHHHRRQRHAMAKLLLLLIGVGLARANNREEVADVREGQDVTLKCRLNNPTLLSTGGQIYWMRQRNGEKDNVAIADTPLDWNYKVDLVPNEGRYDLTISHATYERDNGMFVCRFKEAGTGSDLHTTTVNLTVLIPPGSPRIDPETPTATEGQPIDLECSSQGGSPDPQIIWYRSGSDQKLQSVLKPGGGRDFATTSVLTINPGKDDDGAQYRCVIWNRALTDSEKMEAVVTLSVNYYPRITIGPENPLRVELDQTAVLTCSADAKPPVSNVRWTRGGRFIGTVSNLKIERVSLDDAGRYVCQADNGLGRLREAEVTLDVLYGPRVSVISSKDVDEREDVIISCNVTANPAPVTIEWLKEGDDSFRQNGIDILRLNRVSAVNQGNYVCRAVNILNPTGGEPSDRVGNATVAVRVRHAPGKTFITPKEAIAVQGEQATLTCGADPPGWPMPTYRWWRHDSENTLNLGSNYTIPRASLTDEGTYYCQPSNRLGKGTHASVRVQVHQPPRILEDLPKTAIHRIGKTDLSLTCRAQGKPQPSIRWLKDDEELNPADGLYNILVEQSSVGQNTVHTVQSTLQFRGPLRINDNQLLPTDRGTYKCVFKNDAREVDSSQLLRVEHSPITVHKANKVAFDLKEDAELECRMQAYPQPRFQWSLGPNFIESDGTHYSVNDTALHDDVYASVLTIKGVTEADYGSYTCKGTNTLGEHKTIITLQEKGRPEHPTNLHIINQGTHSIELAWEESFNGGFANTLFYVQAETMSGEMMSHDCQTQNPCTIQPLPQQTAFKLRVKAGNMMGESDFSEPIDAMTLIDVDTIPEPEEVYFERSSDTVSFRVLPTDLMLQAQIELRDGSGKWTPMEKLLPIGSGAHDHGEVYVGEEEPEEVRIRFCSIFVESSCGNYRDGMKVDYRPSMPTQTMSMQYMVAIIVGCVVFVALVALIFICCCCCRRRNNKLKNKTADMEVSHRSVVTQQAPPPPYYTVGMDNKGLDGSMDTGLDDPSKTAIYSSQQYHNYSQNGHINNAQNNNGMGYMDNSYSNSNNGGSVNSQDSLWQVKGHGDPQMTTHMSPHMSQDSRGYQYDPMVHGGYGISGYDDYSHYPASGYQGHSMMEDYPGSRTNYAANGDPYNAVHKQRKRVDHIDGDVSGMPDPYMEHYDQGAAEMNPENKPQISFDESLESGYSTPNSRNRRIIREIIV
ncbi:hemicentin-1-like isoform X1 [Portunus trituberculatus]|uniref:hemicentin-1-like isoform X1 n=2 Tax=Portunus trituberculatus TaxID=210409 RepID=UPI001E1CF26A|nr:hemicentin-1-like isoform X1 [Portunus trituberculatus]